MNLFDDPVLFRAWGTDWYVTKICVVTGVFLWVMAGRIGWGLARHTKAMQWQTMSSAEAADLAVNAGRAPHERLGQVYAGKAVGVSGEISFGVDDLRQAAHRGDWLTFLLWPVLFSCAFGGGWFFFTGLTLSMPRAVWIALTILLVPMTGFGWFMAWAAIYTNIDAGTARKRVSGEGPGR
jgi:hypothetical protein